MVAKKSEKTRIMVCESFEFFEGFLVYIFGQWKRRRGGRCVKRESWAGQGSGRPEWQVQNRNGSSA